MKKILRLELITFAQALPRGLIVLALFFGPLLSRAESDLAWIETIIEKGSSLPQNKRQALEQLLVDLSAGDHRRIESLMFGAPPSVYELLLHSLVTDADNHKLEMLVEQIESTDEATFKFLSQLREQVQKDPQRLDRIENNLNILYGSMVRHSMETPAIGKRWLQATLITLGAGGLIYSVYPNMVYMYHQGSESIFLQPQLMLLGLFATATINEVRVLRKSWRDYKNSFKTKVRAMEQVRVYRRMVSALKRAPQYVEGLSRLKFFSSVAATEVAQEAVAAYAANFHAEMQLLKKSPETWAELLRFFNSKNFFHLVQKLNSRLTEQEKLLLLRKVKDPDGAPLPIEIDTEILAFETSVFREFREWMNETNNTTFRNQFERLLQQERQNYQTQQSALEPRVPYAVTTNVLSFVIAVQGLQFAAGAFDWSGYSQTWDLVAHFFKSYKSEINHSMAGLVIGAIGNQIFQHYKLVRRLKSHDFEWPMSPSRVRALAKMAARMYQSEKQIEKSCVLLLTPDLRVD